MKATLLLSILSATTASASLLKLDFSKERISSRDLAKRQNIASGDLDVSLTQIADHSLYWINITIGTPGQQFALQLDTGSSDLWIPASTSEACKDDGCSVAGGFDSTKSSTFKVQSQDTFDIEYGDGDHEHGDYITDVITIGGTTVQNMTMGLAYQAAEGQGLLGVGYDLLESSAPNYTFPTIIDQLKKAGTIERAAFSLWLNDLDSDTGSILFGGVDTSKYHGDLVGLPIQQNIHGHYTEFRVDLTAISFDDDSGSHVLTADNFSTPALLDSGTTLTQLPPDVATALFGGLGAVSAGGTQYVPCSYATSNASLTYTFGGEGGPTISVPLSEIIDTVPSHEKLFGNNVPACVVLAQASADGDIILGDSFLRSAYVVYDLENNEVAIAATNFNATKADIQAIPSGTGMPGVSSTATAMAATAAAQTAPPGAATSAIPTGNGGAAPGTPTFNLGPAATSGNAGTTSTGKPKKGAAVVTASMDPVILGFAVLSSLACGLGASLFL